MTAATECLDDDSLLSLASGLLAPEALARAEAHVDTCDRCRELLATALSDELRADPADDPLPRPGSMVGRYRITRFLGAGAMATVFSAWDTVLDRTVALKILKAPLTHPQERQRFDREARALAQIAHPNIVALFDVDVTGHRGTLALEFVDLGTARSWLASQRRTWREVCQLYLQAAEGLSAAHRLGIVHRDFKPDNVLVRSDGRAQVTDFGLAHVTPQSEGLQAALDRPLDEMTRLGALIGTPAYMAPEQLEGRQVGPAADQFALAVALYEALTGRRPYEGSTARELKRAIDAGPPGVPPLRQMPRALYRVLTRALAADPLQRWPSVDAMARAIRRVVGLRTRVLVSLAVGVVLALLVSAGLGLWSAVRQSRVALAQAYLEKARLAESQLRWPEAVAWYQAAVQTGHRQDAVVALNALRPRVESLGAPIDLHDEVIRRLHACSTGERLLVGGSSETVRVFEQGRQTHQWVTGESSPTALTFDARCAQVYVGTREGDVWRWSLDDDRHERVLKAATQVNALETHGSMLAWLDENGGVFVRDLALGESRELTHFERPAYVAQFTPDGSALLSGSWSGEIRLNRVADGAEVWHVMAHQGSVLALAVEPSGARVLTGGRDGNVQVIELATGRVLRTFGQHTQKVYETVWSADGRWFASVGADGRSQMYDAEWLEPVTEGSIGFDDELYAATVNAQGQLLVGGRSGRVWPRALPGGAGLQSSLIEHRTLREDAQGAWWVGGVGALMQVTGGATVRALRVPHHENAMVLWADETATLALTEERGPGLQLVSVETGETVLTVSADETRPPHAVELNHAKDRLAIFTASNRLLLVSVTKRTVEFDRAWPVSVHDLVFSPDDTQLALARYDWVVEVLSLADGSTVHQWRGHKHGVRSMAWAPDGQTLASGSWDREVKLWRLGSETPVLSLVGHQDAVSGLDFSRDGRLLVSASHDGTVRVWQTRDGALLARFAAEEPRLSRVKFSRDGSRIAYTGHRLHFISWSELDDPSVEKALQARTHLRVEGMQLVRAP